MANLKCVPSNRNAHSNLGSEYVNNLNGRRRIVHLVTEVAARLVETLRLVTLKWYRDAHLREESIRWFTQPNSGCVNLRRDISRKWERNEACLLRLYRSGLSIYMIDMYYTPPSMQEEGIRIGEKSPDRRNGYQTRAQTDLLPCELQTGSQPNFRKGANCCAEPARRHVPHIEKCSPIRSTNLHYSSCYDDERSRVMEKIVTIWLRSADSSSLFSRVGRRPRKMVKYHDFQMFFGPRFSPPGLTGPNEAKIPLDLSSFGTDSLDRTSVRNWTRGDDW